MAQATTIEWTEQTWNPIRGCSKISPGCKHCYAMRIAARFNGPGQAYEGLAKRDPDDWTGILRPIEEKFDEPIKRERPTVYFVNSMSDLFHEAVSVCQIAHVFGIMAYCRQHTFQVLTKRAERLARVIELLSLERCLNEAGLAPDFMPAWPLTNVWLGVSAENRQHGLPRIDHLRGTPAFVRFLSIEPLLEDLGRLDLTGIHWVIVGGESGRGARPMHPQWPINVRDQCLAAGVPFFFKQWGQWQPCGEMSEDEIEALYVPNKVARDGRSQTNLNDVYGRRCLVETRMIQFDGSEGYNAHRARGLQAPAHQVFAVGKKRAGRMLGGREWNEFPATLHEAPHA